jgi:hypothetical protein
MKIMGGMLLAAVLWIGSGCTRSDWIDRTLVTVDVTGTWEGTSSSGASYHFTLAQLGTRVQGSARRMGGITSATITVSGPVEGTVAGDTFSLTPVGPLNFSDEMRVSGDEMTGKLLDRMGNSPVTLRRVESSPPPSAPKP